MDKPVAAACITVYQVYSKIPVIKHICLQGFLKFG